MTRTAISPRLATNTRVTLMNTPEPMGRHGHEELSGQASNLPRLHLRPYDDMEKAGNF
jgi:hypothetical protein